jgi:hypothetical protein
VDDRKSHWGKGIKLIMKKSGFLGKKLFYKLQTKSFSKDNFYIIHYSAKRRQLDLSLYFWWFDIGVNYG